MKPRLDASPSLLLGAVLALAACGEDPGRTLSDASRDASAADTATPDAAAAPDTSTTEQDATSEAFVDPPDSDLTPDLLPDGSAGGMDAAAPMLRVGAQARVTASTLNLRSGPGTTNAVLTTMPCGATVDLLGGPMSNWWNVRYTGMTGWASGAYLTDPASFDPAVCMSMPAMEAGTMSDGAAMPTEIANIFALARSAVGYSYYWGHGSWNTTGTDYGTCSGSCPGCSHTGRYGADCSGFVAKVWQIPGASPVTTDQHPYSTYNFFNQTTHWSRVDRASVRPGDALVYNASGAGHIFLFESGDPWGSMWTYEARGCSTGIVHNLRTATSAYVGIRREGL